VETQRQESPAILARNIFLEDLDMPTDSVIKIIEQQTGIRVTELDVNTIRTGVSKAISRAMPPKIYDSEQKFTNRPRLIIAKPKEAAMPKRERTLVDVNEKRAWLNDWVLEKGGLATIKEAKEALIAKFGEALGTSYIARTLKDARQLLLEERNRQREEHPIQEIQPSPDLSPLRETVRNIAHLMKTAGIKKISVEGDEVSFEASTPA